MTHRSQRPGRDAFDDECRRADTVDSRAHLDQELTQVGNFGFASCVGDGRATFGMHSGAHDVFGGAHRREVECDLGSVKFVGHCLDVTRIGIERHAHRTQTRDVHVDRPITEVVSTRHVESHPTTASDERTENVDRGSDALDVLGRRIPTNVPRIGENEFVMTSLGETDLDSERSEKRSHREHIGDSRHIRQPMFAVGQQ